MDNKLITCRSCKGKGYLENSKNELQKCPVCLGTGTTADTSKKQQEMLNKKSYILG